MQVCVGAKSKAQCAIALQFASRAFSGAVPEELENLVRAATGIASDCVETNKDANNSKSAKKKKCEEEETNCKSLIGATPDRYLRYVLCTPFNNIMDGIYLHGLRFPAQQLMAFYSFINTTLNREDAELAQEAWGMLHENFPKVAQDHLESFITSLCNAGSLKNPLDAWLNIALMFFDKKS
jgi:hypothetical protein